MSDTTKLILGIALAIVVIALIVWLFASARRREAEARRMEAEAVRAKLAEKIPVVQDREDRASVTARIAEEARREAEAAAAEAERLEREAAGHRSEAEQLRSEQDELARHADRLDPDVRTDAEGYRVDDSGRRLPGSTVASALGMSALAHEDEEPDLADHENPFASYAAKSAPSSGSTPESSTQDLPSDPGRPSAHSGHPTVGDDAGDPDWVNGPVDEEAADELEGRAAADAEAVDWVNGPDEDEALPESEYSTGPESTGSEHSTVGEGPEGAVPGPEEGAPFDEEEPLRGPRRVSGLEEVVDGGYGVGSAAPIDDGAQPLGHPIMGFHETLTFVVPGAGGYGEAEPDVWFYDEDAARRAGFHAAGED